MPHRDPLPPLSWDDLRLFLALSRAGSVRAGGEALGLAHSTLSRRLEALEGRLRTALVQRLPRGVALTEAGRMLAQRAERMEEEIDAARREIDGRDLELAGEVRATMPDLLATEVLTDAVASFARRHPAIELEVMVSYEALDLGRREADVAVRFTRLGEAPPEHLVGRLVAVSFAAAFASPGYLEGHDLGAGPGDGRPKGSWLGWGDGIPWPPWVRDGPLPHLPARGRLNNAVMQLAAARAGMGLAMIPCCLGDRDPGLVRATRAPARPARDVWVLTHEDLRRTARMRAFRDHMTDAIRERRALFEGERG